MENNILVDDCPMESPFNLNIKDNKANPCPEENPSGLVCNRTLTENAEENTVEIENGPLQKINGSKADDSGLDDSIKMDWDESFDAARPNNNTLHQSTLVCDMTFSNNNALVSDMKILPNSAESEFESFEDIEISIFDAVCATNNDLDNNEAVFHGTFCESLMEINQNPLLSDASPFRRINNDLNDNETKKTEGIAPTTGVKDGISTSNKKGNKSSEVKSETMLDNSMKSEQISTQNKELFKTNEAICALENICKETKNSEEINVLNKEVIKNANSESTTKHPELEEILLNEVSLESSFENVCLLIENPEEIPHTSNCEDAIEVNNNKHPEGIITTTTTNSEEMNTSNCDEIQTIKVNTTASASINNNAEEILSLTKASTLENVAKQIKTIEVDSASIIKNPKEIMTSTMLENVCTLTKNSEEMMNTSPCEAIKTIEDNNNAKNPEEMFTSTLENVCMVSKKPVEVNTSKCESSKTIEANNDISITKIPEEVIRSIDASALENICTIIKNSDERNTSNCDVIQTIEVNEITSITRNPEEIITSTEASIVENECTLPENPSNCQVLKTNDVNSASVTNTPEESIASITKNPEEDINLTRAKEEINIPICDVIETIDVNKNALITKNPEEIIASSKAITFEDLCTLTTNCKEMNTSNSQVIKTNDVINASTTKNPEEIIVSTSNFQVMKTNEVINSASITNNPEEIIILTKAREEMNAANYDMNQTIDVINKNTFIMRNPEDIITSSKALALEDLCKLTMNSKEMNSSNCQVINTNDVNSATRNPEEVIVATKASTSENVGILTKNPEEMKTSNCEAVKTIEANNTTSVIRNPEDIIVSTEASTSENECTLRKSPQEMNTSNCQVIKTNEVINSASTTKNPEEIIILTNAKEETNATNNDAIQTIEVNQNTSTPMNPEEIITSFKALTLEDLCTLTKIPEEMNTSNCEAIKTNEVNSATRNPEEIIVSSISEKVGTLTKNPEQINTSNCEVVKSIEANNNNTSVIKNPEEIITSSKAALTLENICTLTKIPEEINTTNCEGIKIIDDNNTSITKIPEEIITSTEASVLENVSKLTTESEEINKSRFEAVKTIEVNNNAIITKKPEDIINSPKEEMNATVIETIEVNKNTSITKNPKEIIISTKASTSENVCTLTKNPEEINASNCQVIQNNDCITQHPEEIIILAKPSTSDVCALTKKPEEMNTSNCEANKIIEANNNTSLIKNSEQSILSTKVMEEINAANCDAIEAIEVNKNTSITKNPEEIIKSTIASTSENVCPLKKNPEEINNNTSIMKNPEEIIVSAQVAINKNEFNSDAITTLEDVYREAKESKQSNALNKEKFKTNEVKSETINTSAKLYDVIKNSGNVNISYEETIKSNTTLRCIMEGSKIKDMDEFAMESSEAKRSSEKLVQAAVKAEEIMQDSLELHFGNKAELVNEKEIIEEATTPNEDEMKVTKGFVHKTLSNDNQLEIENRRSYINKIIDNKRVEKSGKENVTELQQAANAVGTNIKANKNIDSDKLFAMENSHPLEKVNDSKDNKSFSFIGISDKISVHVKNNRDEQALNNSFCKSPKTAKDNQSMEDHSPQKIKPNSNDGIIKRVKDAIGMSSTVKSPSEVDDNISLANKDHFNWSIFSSSSAKVKPGNKRDSLLSSFDPLYSNSSSIQNTPLLPYCGTSQFYSTETSNEAKMDDAIDEKMRMEQELNKLKLELNQLQQERTTQQLELHQKEEVILKIQGEAQKISNQYKYEIKQMQDKLNVINEQNNNEEVKLLKEEISKLKDRDVQLTEKNSKLQDQISSLESSVVHFETTLDRVMKESEKVRSDHDNTKKHLATLEMSFSDVHAKYERTKEIVVAYKNNEEVLADKMDKFEEIARRYEERYNTLKAHAKAQLDKANKELSAVKDKHQLELNKMTALLRRLEIKCGSIQQALDQKTKECADLAALCDEWAGSGPQ